MKNLRRWQNEQTYVRRVGVVCGISSEFVPFIVIRGGDVWMMSKRDMAYMLAVSVMIVIATELFIRAITGSGALIK